jgi:ribonucleoside-diphosphate reductase alpha chain
MLEKTDVKRSRTARTGSISAKPAHPPSSGKTAAAKAPAVAPYGLKLQRYFTAAGDDGFANVEWELRTAAITGENGKMVFEQKDVEVPKSWSQTATNVVVQKYFRGIIGTPDRERSVRQLISRVADTITGWGQKDGYFADEESARVFNAELKHLLVQQKMSFNSPVWFNVGIEKDPQCSACFINSVEDTMESILGLAKTEGMLFKYGSGTGTNLSPIRLVEGAAERRRHGRAARSASCAASTPSRASSSRAARPAAPRRWSS